MGRMSALSLYVCSDLVGLHPQCTRMWVSAGRMHLAEPGGFRLGVVGISRRLGGLWGRSLLARGLLGFAFVGSLPTSRSWPLDVGGCRAMCVRFSVARRLRSLAR